VACRAEVCAAFDELQATLHERIQPEAAESAEDRRAVMHEVTQLISEGLAAHRLLWQDHMAQQEASHQVLSLRLDQAEDALCRERQKQRKPPAPPAILHAEPMLPEAKMAGDQATVKSLAGDVGKWPEELAAPVLQAATMNTATGSETAKSVGSLTKKDDSSIEHSTENTKRIMLRPPAWRGRCTPPAPMHPAPPQPSLPEPIHSPRT